MEGNAPVMKHGAPKTPKKDAKKKKRSKNHHKKSRSKSKKTGFLCCRSKKRKRSKKHRKSKSTTKKQPRVKPVKPLPPVQNEQLGEIVLVKDKGKIPVGGPPKEPQSPDKIVPPKPVKSSKETESAEDKPQKKSKKEEKSDTNDKKVEEKKEKKEEDDSNEEKKQKWLGLAKRFVTENANMAIKDFPHIASYIPQHVTKQHFVENMYKNRFSDVICMDHSRVTLSDDTYIHASYVDIDPSKRAILTQMPLPHTAADFWQMIIEKRVKCVLLLLSDAEYEQLGGDFVFPRNQDFLHFEERSIRVGEFKRVEIMTGWFLKVLSVCNGDYKSFLHIHHYNAWPHNSVPFQGSPQGAKQIWQLQSALRKYSQFGPPVYMSLSGCGRAGTYALFETAHASLHSGDKKLDMIKCLEIVRNGRLHSCQSLSQFSFVYTLLAEHILDNGFCKLAMPKKSMEKDDNDSGDEKNVQAILRQLTVTKSWKSTCV
uniref:Tyrosine-protein phosphatase domain-containing protein n=1 Tax=Caenorhabditis tropicalis TaxID=1561998 RepID=A0A1I7TKX0_9PELO